MELIEVNKLEDVLPKYRNTPIELLLGYHNLDIPLQREEARAELIIGTCIDYRQDFHFPHDFAYIIRSAGGNMQSREFQISFAVSIGRVATLALMSHTDCGMSNVTQKREEFVQGLIERAGCSREEAERQFTEFAPTYEIGDPVEFILRETSRIRRLYPKILVAPLLYRVEDDKIVQIVEKTPHEHVRADTTRI